MRCNFAVFLVLLLHSAHAWKFLSFPHFLLNAIYRIPTSPIPQVILDIHHPWVQENKHWLERRLNVAAELCAFNSTLRPDPSTSLNGSRTYPADLFSRINIDNNRPGISRFGWANAVARAEELLNCPAALFDVTELNIDIFVHHGISYESTDEPFNPPVEAPRLFADALHAMPNLRRLRWTVPAPQTEEFARVFSERNLTLPAVRELETQKLSHYMIGVCPGIQSLETLDVRDWGHHPADPRLLLIRAAAEAKNLTQLSMGNAGFKEWDAELLKEVLAAMPNLTRLDVRGTLGSGYRDYGNPYMAGEALTEFSDILAKFPNLTDLSLPSSSNLGLGFDGGPWCGNAYDGPDGDDLYRQVIKDDAVAVDMATEIVLQRLQNLRTLTIGDRSLNLTMGADSKNVTWPWTGRMDEWAREIVPYIN